MGKNINIDPKIWDEEEITLKNVHNIADKKIEECKETICKSQNAISRGGYEAQNAWMEESRENEKINKCEKDVEEISDYKKSPYFAHISLTNNDDITDFFLTENMNPPIQMLEDNSYILSISGDGELVKKIRENYYNNSVENINFKNSKYRYEILRKLFISSGKLEDIHIIYPVINEETGEKYAIENITDTFLLNLLNKRRTEKNMTNIIASIQKKQYEIIALDYDENFIVQGCAGSGKTQIMVHRLFFLKGSKEKIDQYKVFIITPAKLFDQYSAEMMNSLGLSNIPQLTIEQYYLRLICMYDSSMASNKFEIVDNLSEFPIEYVDNLYHEDLFKKFEKEIKKKILGIKQFLLAMNFCDSKATNHEVFDREKCKEYAKKIYLIIKEQEEIEDKIKNDATISKIEKEYKSQEKELKKQRKIKKNASKALSELWQSLAETEDEKESSKIENKINKKMDVIKATDNNITAINILMEKLSVEKEKTIKKFRTNNKMNCKFDKEGLVHYKRVFENVERNIFLEIADEFINPVRRNCNMEEIKKFNGIRISKPELIILLQIKKELCKKTGIRKYNVMYG